jgi:hypothetical protein
MANTHVFERLPHWGLLSLILLVGCASATAARSESSMISESEGAAAPPLPPLPGQGGEDGAAYDSADGQASDELALRVSTRRMAAAEATSSHAPAPEPMAQATPTPPPDQAPPLSTQPSDVRSDASASGPVLVYTASFLLSVYEVEKAQTELKAAAQKLGGFVSVHTDTQITLRVPAQQFEAALTAVESTGKVRARNVQALDVGDQYRDLSIRLRTAEAVRSRLEAMLARADNVEQALQVERELERVVREIEQLKGQLRSLGDRIAFSTLVVEFRPEERPDIDDSDVFRLPYPWLDELGLHHLLELAP